MVAVPLENSPSAFRPGTVLCGKYRIERELARGGMGAVVVATHLKLERPVAIKLVTLAGRDPGYAVTRFLREARAAARLSSDHVVRVLDLDEAPDGTPFLVMELLEGEDLEHLLAAQGKVAIEVAVDLGLQACAALAEAHARGIIHRDVKPANLFLVRRADGSSLLKLLDFGISKVLSDELNLTRTAATMGSPLFMSPEQLLAPSGVDLRTDLWSLGVTLYRLLAGAPPFTAADASALAALIAARPPTPLSDVAPGIPAALAAAVMRCLEKDAAARFPSALALAEALEPFRAPGGLGALAQVRLADAMGQAAATAAPALASPAGPAAASSSAASWTLSHDLPAGRSSADASAAGASSRAAMGGPPRDLPRSADGLPAGGGASALAAGASVDASPTSLPRSVDGPPSGSGDGSSAEGERPRSTLSHSADGPGSSSAAEQRRPGTPAAASDTSAPSGGVRPAAQVGRPAGALGWVAVAMLGLVAAVVLVTQRAPASESRASAPETPRGLGAAPVTGLPEVPSRGADVVAVAAPPTSPTLELRPDAGAPRLRAAKPAPAGPHDPADLELKE